MIHNKKQYEIVKDQIDLFQETIDLLKKVTPGTDSSLVEAKIKGFQSIIKAFKKDIKIYEAQ